MSRKPQAISPVPAETARRARAAYPKGNVSMHMRDVLGSISSDEDVADVFPKDGQPAEAAWRLALVTVMHCVENLSDQQAADAVRGRLDGKYLLGLELTASGFDASVLSEFRARLIDHHAEERLLEKMLTLFPQKGWLKARGRQRTDSTHGDRPRFALSTASFVSGKRCGLRSRVSQELLLIGCVLTAREDGWNALDLAVRTRVLLWEKPSAWRLPRKSDSRVSNCLMPSVIQRPLSGFTVCQREKSCGK